MPEAFALRLPPEYFRWMRALDWMSLDWFRVRAPPECFGDFAARLTQYTTLPLVGIALLWVVGALAGGGLAHFHERRSSSILSGAQAGIIRMLPISIAALYAFVPFCSMRIFSTFRSGGTP